MTERENHSLEEIDALVGAYLAKRAAQIDAQMGLARVRAGLGKPLRYSSPAGPRFKPTSLAAGFAAALALALLGSVQLGPVQATPLELVREVKRVHNQELERAYVADIKLLADVPGYSLLGKFRQIHIWTRGDRFRAEMQPKRNARVLHWGRDEEGMLWTVLDEHRGVRIPTDQLPLFSIWADVLSLNLDTMLNHALQGCILVETPDPYASKLTRTVRAVPRTRTTRFWLEEASLEIDTEARVLRRLTLHRNHAGKPVAKLTFTLVDTRPSNDVSFHLEGRLLQPMQIFEKPLGREIKTELLAAWEMLRPGGQTNDDPPPKPNSHKPAAPDKALNLEFKSIDGAVYTPLATPNKKASVLLFMLPDCPICNASIPEINRICAEYEQRGVNLFVVHADPDVTVEDARKHAKDYRLPCPILLDPNHVLVKRMGAKIAPEAAVLAPDGKAVYLGRINDLYFDYGKKRAVPQQHDLRNALDAILAGKPVPAPLGKAIGCHIPTLDK